MSFVLVLVCTTAFVWVLKTPLLKCPVAFYVLAMLLNVLYVSSAFTTYPEAMRQTLFLLMQKCTLSLAVFTVVMFIGAFRKDSVVSLALRPVRAELSILACVLALGHMVMYLMSFAPRLLNGSAIDSGFLLFFATAIALMALLLILGATSFKGVKRRMDATAWKRLQKWAYVFFGLVYVHLVSILLPAALLRGDTARTSIVVYTVLFGAYAALRIHRAMKDRKTRRAERLRCAG
ncbi:ferric reductase-like transmembrane domain-containing protein [Raoultibacter timonensis]|uniref:Sulfite oxidase n=1 Tax=Raoultibacter timonensis TaxID=1907662 RepID=A0ABM7WGP8_9ACTN|nr:ferric reductase-like transmembrane domain-containing protein [Raoultibacter timonensis]BDE95406.1 sulfite oxidase [Raoultibacter timonensis]BDF50009.1 sulfite oxidase [Raoultibacter timonensis]